MQEFNQRGTIDGAIGRARREITLQQLLAVFQQRDLGEVKHQHN